MSENKSDTPWPNVSAQLIDRLDEFTSKAIPMYSQTMNGDEAIAALAFHSGMKFMVDKLRVTQNVQAKKIKQTNIRTSVEG